MMDWNDHMSTGGWIFMAVWMVIVLAILVAATVWLISTLGGRRDASASGEASAREILDRRLARGELTLEQHRQMREAIGAGGASTQAQPSRPAEPPG